MIALARQEVDAQALGDGAIALALQALRVTPQPIIGVVQTEAVYRGVRIEVQIMPFNGLIDINQAPAPLLQRLFTVAGGLTPDAAQALAQTVIQVRQQPDRRGRAQPFETEEDLLRVPGIDYDLYARLAGLLTADIRGSGRVNPLAAPMDVLVVLADGNIAQAQKIAAARDAGQVAIDTSALDARMLAIQPSRRLRVLARVPLADSGFMRVVRDIELDARTPTGAPWLIFRAITAVEPVNRNHR